MFAVSITIFRQLLGGKQQHRNVKPTQDISQSTVATKPAAVFYHQDYHELPMDKNSTIASDIGKIWHDPDSMTICVSLKQTARCPHPALLGRLSGPALAILEWKEVRLFPIVDSDDIGTVLCGGYGHYWLDPGDYFVEIIILHCKDFGVSALQRTNNLTAWMEANHKYDCVEDANHNRITSKEGKSVIHIPTLTRGRDKYRQGRWIRNPQFTSKPLVTRYQPVECFREKPAEGSSMELYCDSITERDTEGRKDGREVTGLYEYEFQWNMNVSEQTIVERLRHRLHSNDSRLPNVCALGDSHSLYMKGITLPLLNLTGLFSYVRSVWFSPKKITKIISEFNCDIFFVQVGQWPASHKSGGYPFSFRKYHDKLKQMLEKILEYNPKAIIYLPTIDQTPLMSCVNECIDWRTPTLLDGYSYVNQMVVKELNMDQVKYMDTNFIINTHWDGGTDWQHLMEIVRSRKTIYASAIMLGETQWFL